MKKKKTILIKDIKPNKSPGTSLLNKDGIKTIAERIEGPLQKPCQLFREKNIQTVMSSANESNILKEGETRAEKGDVYAHPKYPRHVFYKDVVGVGYAWIMIDYNSLSIENKNILFELEQDLGENCIWFTQEHEDADRLDQIMQIWFTGRSDYDHDLIWDKKRKIYIKSSDDDTIDEPDELEGKFKEKAIYLGCPDRYPVRNVFVRMPVDEKTTDEEVEKYFSDIAEKMKNQREHNKNDLGLAHGFVKRVKTPRPIQGENRSLANRLRGLLR